MKSKMLIKLMVLVTSIILLNNSFAQQKGKVISVHPIVGKVICKFEKERFGLFKDVKDFYQAKILKTSSNEFEIQFYLLTNKATIIDTIVKSSFELIIEMNRRIAILSSGNSEIESLSSEVGKVIDKNERMQFRLFEDILNFNRAVIYNNYDTSFSIHIEVGNKDSTLNDTTVVISKHNFLRLKEFVCNSIRTREGKYKLSKLSSEQDMNNYLTFKQRVIIKKNDGSEIDGELISIKDSLLIFNPLQNKNLLEKNKEFSDTLLFSQIESITIVKNSQILSGMGIGFLSGAGIGVIVGLLDGDDKGLLQNAWSKAIILGTVSAIVGTIFGAAVGARQSEDQEVIFKGSEGLGYLNKYSKKTDESKKIKKREVCQF